MALLQSPPAKGTPKDLFDLMLGAEAAGAPMRGESGALSPMELVRSAHGTMTAIEKDSLPMPTLGAPDALWQKYQFDPRYGGDGAQKPGEKARFDMDYGMVKGAHEAMTSAPQALKASFLYSFGATPRTVWENVGTPQTDKYNLASMFGTTQGSGWHKPEVMVGWADQTYRDYKGDTIKFDGSDFQGDKAFTLDAQIGPHGTVVGPAELRELKPGESPYGRKLFGGEGLGKFDANDFTEFGGNFWSRMVPNTVAMFHEAGTWRVKRMNDLAELFGKQPDPASMALSAKYGGLTSFWGNPHTQGLIGAKNDEDGIRHAMGLAVSMEYDIVHDAYSEYLKDPERYHALAKEGDRAADALVRNAMLVEGSDGDKSKLMLRMQHDLVSSAMADEYQSTFTADNEIDGHIAGALGDGAAQLLQQILVTRGIGFAVGGAMRAASAGANNWLVRSSSFLEAGRVGEQVGLSKLGGRLVIGVGSLLPAGQVAADSYEEARMAGYSHEDASNFALGNASIMALTENIIGTPYMVKSWAFDGGRAARQALSAELPGLRSVMAKGKLAASRQAMAKVFGTIATKGDEIAERLSGHWTGARALGAIQGFASEGSQEILEELGNYANERAYDSGVFGDGGGNFHSADADLGKRLQMAGALGGILGGAAGLTVGKRIRQRQTSSLMQAVVEGHGPEVKRQIDVYEQGSALSPEEAMDARAEVDFAERVKSMWNYEDPHVYVAEKADRSFVVQGVKLRAEEERLKASIMEAKQKVESAPAEERAQLPAMQENLASLESELGSVQQKLADFRSGKQTLRALQDFQIWSSIRSGSLMRGVDVGINAEAVEGFLGQGENSFIGEVMRRSEELSLKRTDMATDVEQLNKAIEGLATSVTPENKVDSLVDGLNKEGALRREDLESLGASVNALKQNTYKEMGLSEKEQENVEEAIKAGGIVPEVSSEKEVAAFEKLMPLADLKSISMDPALLPRDGDPVTAALEETFSTVRRPGQNDPGERIHIKQLLDQISSLGELTEEQSAAYESSLAEAAQQQTVFEVLKNAYPELAQKMTEREAALLRKQPQGWNGKLPEMLAKFKQDNATLFSKLAGADMGDFATDLMKAQMELMRRSVSSTQKLENIRALRTTNLDMRISSALLMVSSGVLGHDIATELRPVIEAATKAHTDGATKDLQRIVVGLERTISKAIAASKSPSETLVEFMKWFKNRHDIAGSSAHYLAVSDWLNANPSESGGYAFVKEYAPELLNRKYGSKQGVSFLTSWVTQMSADRDLVDAAYYAKNEDGSFVEEQPLTWEQEQVARTLLAAAITRDHDLNAGLVGAVMGGDRSSTLVRNGFTVPGSAGVGKTFLLPRVIAAAYRSGNVDKVLFVASGDKNTTDVASRFPTKGVLDTAIVNDVVSGKQTMEGYDMVIFDEAHGLTGEDFVMLREKMSRIDGSFPRQFRLFLGDQSQSPVLGQAAQPFPVLMETMHTDPIMASLRQGNMPLMEFIDQLRSATSSRSSSTGAPYGGLRTIWSPSEKRGVRIVKTTSANAVLDEFASHISRYGVPDVSMIVMDEQARDSALAYLRTEHPEVFAKNGDDQVAQAVQTMTTGQFSALGTTSAQVFAFIPSDAMYYSKVLYTAASRATDLLTIGLPDGSSKPEQRVVESKLNQSVLDGIRVDYEERQSLSSEGAQADVKRPPAKANAAATVQQKIDDGDESVPQPVYNWSSSPGVSGAQAESGRAKPGYLTEHALRTNRMWFHLNAYMPHAGGKVDYAGGVNIRKAVMNAMVFPATVELVARKNAPFINKDGQKEGNDMIVVRLAGQASDYVTLPEGADPEASRIIGMLPTPDNVNSELEPMVGPIYSAAAKAVDGDVLGTFQLDPPSNEEATFRAQWSRNGGESLSYGSFVNSVLESGGQITGGELVDVPAEDGTSDSVPAVRVRSMPYGTEGGWRYIFLDPARADQDDIRRMREQLIADGSVAEGSEVKEFLRQNTAQVLADPELKRFASYGNVFDLTGKAKLDFSSAPDRTAYQSARGFLDAMEALASGEDLKKRPWLPYMVDPKTKRISESSLRRMNVVDRSPIMGPPFPFFRLQPAQENDIAGDLGGNPFSMDPPEYASNVMGSATLRDTIQEAINEAERLLGKRFLNGGLEFRPNLQSLNKEDVSGLMRSGKILARVFEDGKVRKGVIRHEAMHYVLDYLLDPVTRGDIMREASLEMFREGNGYPDERSIHEYLADRFEAKQQPTTFVGRFLAWLKAVARRLVGAEGRIDRLMRRMDSGAFANAPAWANVGQEEYASSMPMDAGSEEQLDDVSSEDEDLDPRAVGMNKLYQRLGHYYAVRPVRRMQTELMFRTYLAPVENTLDGLATRRMNYGQAVEAIYDSYRATVATHRSRFVPDPAAQTIQLRDGRMVSYNALVSSDVRHIVDAQRGIADVWIMDQLSKDRSLYNTMVNVAFPGIRKWSSIVTDVGSEKENAWARDNDRINPTSVMTGPTQIFMQNIPLLTTTVKDGKTIVQQEGSKLLSRGRAERTLMDALGMVRTRIGMNPSFSVRKGLNNETEVKGFSLETLASELENELRKMMNSGNAQSDAARSLYHVLLRGGYARAGSDVVYDGYMRAIIRAQNEVATNPAVSPEQKQVIQERSLELETFLNGLLSQFMSRTPYNASRTVANDVFVDNYGMTERGRPRLMTQLGAFYKSMTGAQNIKNELRSRWGGTAGLNKERAALFAIGVEAADTAGKDVLGDDAGRYLIGYSGDFWGVRERAGKNFTWFLKVPLGKPGTDGKRKIEMLSAKLSHPELSDATAFSAWISKLEGLLHDGYGISGSSPTDGLYAHVLESIIRSRDAKSKELLIDIIGGYGAAVKDSINAWYKRDQTSVAPVDEVDRNNGVFSLTGYRRIAYEPSMASESVNDLGADKETHANAEELSDAEQRDGEVPEGRRQPMISDAWSLAERLDNFFALNSGKQMNRRFKAGSGEMHMMDSLGSPIRDAFPAIAERLSNEGLDAYSQATREYMDAFGLYYESAGQREYPIPFADKDMQQRLFVYKGIELNQQKGSTTYKMNPADAATLQVDLFARSILLNEKSSREYVIPAGYSGGRDQINFIHLSKDPFRTNGQHAIYATNSASGKTAVFIDRDHLSERVEKMLLLYRDRLDRAAVMIRGILGDQAEGFMKGSKNFEKGTPEFMAVLSSDLVHGSAYVIDGTRIRAGSMFVGNEESLVSGHNLGTLFGMTESARRDAIKQWMLVRSQWAQHNMDKVSPGWTLPPSYGKKGEASHGEQFKPAMMEAMTWLHWLADQWTSAFTVGLQTNFKNESDRAKRMKLQGSSGMMGIPSRNGMPTLLNYAYFLDEDANGMPAHDGSSYKMPWMHIMEQVSFGGKTSIVGESSAKPIEATPSYSKKDSEARISAQSYMMSPLQQVMVVRSLGHPDLQKAWVDTMRPAMTPNEEGRIDLEGLEKAFDQATKKILEMRHEPVLNDMGQPVGTYEQYMAHVVVPNSAAKSGFTRGNLLTDDTPFLLTQRPASAKRMQLNPERDSSNNQVSAPSQLIQQIGIASNGDKYYRRIAHIQASMTNAFRKDFEARFRGESGTIEYALFRDKMIELGKRQVAFSSFMGNMLDLVNDKSISVNNPMVSTQLMRAMEAWIQKEGLVRRMKGNLFVSTSGYGYLVRGEDGSARPMGENEVLMPFSHVKHFLPEADQARAKYISLEDVRELITERATMLGGKGVDLLKAFDDALTVVVQRTPLTLSSGARVCKIAGFLSDQSNTIVVHPSLSRMAGADYDVDQWTVYMKHFGGNAFDEVLALRTENEHDTSWLAEQNRILETIIEYYANTPAGADQMTGTAALEAADRELEQEELEAQATNPTPKFKSVSSDLASHFLNHARFFNGKKLTGPAALAIKGYTYLIKAAMADPSVFSGDAFALSNGLAVVDALSSILNGAVDDEKLLILGKRGVTLDNLPILVGAITAGRSLKDALRFISSPEVQGITTQYLATRRIIDRQDGQRESFFRMLKGFLPPVQLDEKGNAVQNEQGGYVMTVPSINMGEALQFYNMGNAINGLVRAALSYNTNAIPVETINERVDDVEMMLGQSLDDFLAGNAAVDPTAYRKNVLGPRLFNDQEGPYAKARLEEEEARWAFFNPSTLLRQLPDVMSWMRMLGSTRTVAQAGFVQLNPAVNSAFGVLAHKLGYNRFPERSRTRVWSLFQENMVATILHGSTAPFKMGEKYYDLSMATEREAFAVDFALLYSDAMHTASVDRRRAEMLRRNKWVENISFGQREGRRPQLVDRTLLADPVYKSESLAGFYALDEIFSDFPSDQKLTELLSLYALISDGFANTKSSLMPGIGMTAALTRFNRQLDMLGASMSKSNDYTVVNPVTGRSVSLMTDGMNAMLKAAARSSLVQRATPLTLFAMEKSNAYHSVRVAGAAVVYRKGAVELQVTGTRNTISVDPTLDSYVSKLPTDINPIKKNWGEGFKRAFHTMSKATFREEVGDSTPYSVGPLRTPFGTMQITKVEKGRITVDMSGATKGVVHDLLGRNADNTQRLLEFLGGDVQALSGAVHAEMLAAQPDTKRLLEAMVDVPAVSSLAKNILDFYQRTGRRIPSLRFERSSPREMGHGRFRYGANEVVVSASWSDDMPTSLRKTMLGHSAMTFLHEMVHATSYGALVDDRAGREEASLTEDELRFRKEIRRISDDIRAQVFGTEDGKQALRDAGIDLSIEAYMSANDEEILTYAQTNPGFSAVLKEFGVGKRNFMQRIWDAIRRLLGLSTDQRDMLSRMNDAYMRFLQGARVAARPQDAYRNQVVFEPAAITDMSDLGEALRAVVPGSMNTSTSTAQSVERSWKTRVDEGWDRIRRDGFIDFGEGMRFTVDGTTDKSAVHRFIQDTVVPFYSGGGRERLIEKMTLALRSQSGIEAGFAANFPNRDKTNTRIEKPVIEAIQHHMDVREDDFVGDLHTLRSGNGMFTSRSGQSLSISDLGVTIPDGFGKLNMLVKVRKHGNQYTVSLFDINANGLSGHAYGMANEKLFASLSTGMVGRALNGVNFTNKEHDIRRLQLMGLAMAIRRSSPSVLIGDILVMKIGSKEFDRYAVDPSDALAALEALRTTEAWNLLPDSVRNVLSDESLKQSKLRMTEDVLNYFSFLEARASTTYDLKAFPSAQRESAEELYQAWQTLPEMRQYSNGLRTDPEGMITAIRERIAFLGRIAGQVSANVDELIKKELDVASRALISAKALTFTNIDVNTKKETSFGALFKSTHNLKNTVVQMVETAIRDASGRIVHWTKKFNDEHRAQIGKLKAGLRTQAPNLLRETMDLGTNSGIDIFSPLFRRSSKDKGSRYAVFDQAGELVDVDIRVLHWDKTDAETAAALASGKLTQAHLDYSNWLLDQMDAYYRKAFRHEVVTTAPFMAKAENKEALAAAIDARMAKAVPYRGALPVTHADMGEKTLSAEVIKEQVQNMAGNIDLMPRELRATDLLANRNAVSDFEMSAANEFLSDVAFGERSGSPLGHARRLGRMGLTLDGSGTPILSNAKNNESLSLDLERMAKLFVMSIESKITHDLYTLPIAYSGRSMLKGLAQSTGSDQTQNIRLIERNINRHVHIRDTDDPERLEGLNMNVNAAVHAATHLTTMTRLSLNLPVAIASLTTNLLNGWSRAIASDLSGQGYFGTKELNWALGVAFMKGQVSHTAEREKMMALMHRYFVYDMGRSDLLYANQHSEVRKRPGANEMHFMNRWTDINMRIAVMAAQMKKDGSWDAYSMNKEGDLVYDQTKDGRFYQGGKLKDGAAAIIERIKQRHTAEGLHEQPQDGPLVTGYDQASANLFKWLADKYIIGAMDAETQSLSNTYLLGRLALQFRRYLPDKIHNWWGGRMESEFGGKWVATKDARGNYADAKWEKAVTVGHLRAMVEFIETLGSGRKLDPAARASLAIGVYDFLLFSAIGLLTAGLWDDDDKRMLQNPAVRRLKMSAEDLVIGSPLLLAETINKEPMPALSMAQGWINVLFGDTKELSKNVPGVSSYKFITGMLPEPQPANPN